MTKFKNVTCILVFFLFNLIDFTYSAESEHLYGERSTIVIEHTERNDFQKDIEKARLVEFYSPWCGACQSFKPKFIKLAGELRKISGEEVEVYGVSCVANKELCNDVEIHGYPSLLAYPVGETKGILLQRSEMGGSYSAEEIAKVMKVTVNGVLKADKAANAVDLIKSTEKMSRRTEQEEEEEQSNEEKDSQGDEEEESKEEAVEKEKEDDEDKSSEDENKDNKNDIEQGKIGEEESKESKVEDKSDDKDKESEGKDESDEKGEKESDEKKEKESDEEEEKESDEEEEKESDEEEEKESDEEEEKESDEEEEKESDEEKEKETDEEEKLSYQQGPDAIPRLRNSERAGAAKAMNKHRDMDKWKAVMEQRKKLAQEKMKKKKGSFIRNSSGIGKKPIGPGGKVRLDTPALPGTTKVMRANTPGTAEFIQRKKDIMKRIEKARKGRSILKSSSAMPPVHEAKLINKSKLPFKKEVKKPGFFRKQLEHVPVVKRIFKMSAEEELIHDATLSFIKGLSNGVFMSKSQLTEEKKDALMSYLELLSISLPAEWGVHILIDDLIDRIDYVSKSYQNLMIVLKRHPTARRYYSPGCSSSNNPFSCGMWKLFHIATLGVAEHRGGLNLVDSGLINPGTRTFNPAQAAEVLRDYIANFFGCDECRNHFVAKYDSCAFRRCDRLANNIEVATADDWKQLALWLWEVHNDVNVQVASKKEARMKKKFSTNAAQGKSTDEIKVLFPSLEDCLVCFNDAGEWNEDSVFEYLERTYWDTPDSKYDRLMTIRKLDDGEDPSGGGVIWYLLLIATVIIFVLRNHINNLSLHKRTAGLTSMIGMKQKIGDAVSGKKRTA